MSGRDDYPLPAHAISIWKVGHQLVLGLPPTSPDSRGTTVTLPLERCEAIASPFGGVLANQRGWAILLDILRQREGLGQRQDAATVGHAAAPVQYDVEQMLRAMGDSAPKGAAPLADEPCRPRAGGLAAHDQRTTNAEDVERAHNWRAIRSTCRLEQRGAPTSGANLADLLLNKGEDPGK